MENLSHLPHEFLLLTTRLLLFVLAVHLECQFHKHINKDAVRAFLIKYNIQEGIRLASICLHKRSQILKVLLKYCFISFVIDVVNVTCQSIVRTNLLK